MKLTDLLTLIRESTFAHPVRTFLTILGIVIGTGAVIFLSSLGEGTRQAIAEEFSQFGTTVLTVTPGKSETFGISGAVGGTTRRLTLEDARALERVPGVRAIATNVIGTAPVEFGKKSRNVYITGTSPEATEVWDWKPRIGNFLPDEEAGNLPRICVLGKTLHRELFGSRNPLGKFVRIGEHRFRVIGIMESKGNFLGMDLDDMAFVPVKHAMRIFNQFELHEININVSGHANIQLVEKRVTSILKQRHDGTVDFTVTSQAAMLDVINNVMSYITWGVIAISAISILVGAMGILTVIWLSVHERTNEIGLLKAIGASNRQILILFLGEATFLGGGGGVLGSILGLAGGEILDYFVPIINIRMPGLIFPSVILVSLLVGFIAGFYPARKAAALKPIDALREE